MRRRDFIVAIGGAATWPMAARAQQRGKLPVIGFMPVLPSAAFLEGLKSAGYVEGENVTIEYPSADDRFERLQAIAKEFVRRRVAVIVASGNQSIFAAKAATSTIPIVFSNTTDPVLMGYAAAINRPGGNLTGWSMFNVSLAGKRLDLLRQLVGPKAALGALLNPKIHRWNCICMR